ACVKELIAHIESWKFANLVTTLKPPELPQGELRFTTVGKKASTGNKTDETALLDSVYGALQLAFSNKTSTLISALTKLTYPMAKKNWGPKDFDVYKTATLDFFTQRKAYSKQELSKIKAPVNLVHGLDDVAYPLEYTVEQEKIMKDAGLNVILSPIANAPHFVVIDYGLEVNGVLHDFVMKYTKGPVASAPSDVVSPWDSSLRKAGWVPEDMSDDED
ncbi:hypothetical protein MPER_04510, partial [Moniliophthora perniciosa FA553]